MRCTATKTTPAVERTEKNNQLKWNAGQMRSGAMNNPAMNVTAPSAASAIEAVLRRAGIGRLDAAITSSGDETRTGCRLTCAPPEPAASVRPELAASEQSELAAWPALSSCRDE